MSKKKRNTWDAVLGWEGLLNAMLCKFYKVQSKETSAVMDYTRSDLRQEGWLIIHNCIEQYPKWSEDRMRAIIAKALWNRFMQLVQTADERLDTVVSSEVIESGIEEYDEGRRACVDPVETSTVVFETAFRDLPHFDRQLLHKVIKATIHDKPVSEVLKNHVYPRRVKGPLNGKFVSGYDKGNFVRKQRAWKKIAEEAKLRALCPA